MAITKTITKNSSKGHHKFTLTVTEDRTSGNSSFMSFSFVLSPIQTGWDWNTSGVNYYITIGDKEYSGPIYRYDGSSTVTIASESDIEIPHETDGTKTIDIAFNVVDSTSYNFTPGNAKASSTLELTKLHEPPTFDSVTFKETNQQLVNLEVGDNYFVSNLSIKNITIEATPSDGAKITKYEIINGGKTYSSTTNVVQMNFQQNPLGTVYLDYLGRDVAELTIRVTDDLGGVMTVAYPDTYVIPYTKPSIEKTSTTIKRKTGGGVTLTDNKAVLNFIGNCYKGNDVIGNNNTPKVQYKIWNTTEPTNYTSLTTPNAASITIKDYQISNIDYLKVYNYKIKIYDTFTTAETTINVKEDKVPTGVSVWTEYPDRVDFIRVTVNNRDVMTKPVVLYENESGSNTSITLSDNVSNYEYIEIYYRNNGKFYDSTKIYQANDKASKLTIEYIYTSGNFVYTENLFKSIYIENNSITVENYGYLQTIDKEINNVNTTTNYIYITRVVGYK